MFDKNVLDVFRFHEMILQTEEIISLIYYFLKVSKELYNEKEKKHKYDKTTGKVQVKHKMKKDMKC